MPFLKPSLILLFFSVLWFTSCRKDPHWDLSVNAPLFNASLGIEDFIEDSMLQINPDSSLTVIFDTELFSLSSDSVVSVPDSLYYINFIIPIGLQAAPGALVMQKTESKYYDMDGAKLTEMNIRSGKLVVRAYNYVGDDALIEYSLDNSLLNGSPVVLSGIMPSYPLTGEYLYKEFDVSGMKLDLRESYLNCNALTSTIKLYANPYATHPVQINYGDSVEILVEFQDVVLDYARGYFGNHLFDEEDVSEFDVFSDIGLESIDLENVKMSVEIENNFGADASFQLKYLNGIGQNSVALISPWIGKTINIPRAVESPSLSGNVIPSKILLDFTNDNVEQFIENLPTSIAFGMNGELNPLGNISTGNDFMYYGKGFRAMAHLEIPLNIAFSNLTLRDTVNFDISKSDSYISEAVLSLNISNGFPLSANFKIILLNENNLPLDSIFPETAIPAAPVNLSGRVTAPIQTIVKLFLNESQTLNLYASKKAIIEAVFNTGSEGEKIKIFSDYKLLFFVSGLFDYQVNP